MKRVDDHKGGDLEYKNHRTVSDGRKRSIMRGKTFVEAIMEIVVKHNVADDPVRCVTHDGTTFEGSTICGYHGFRDQTHGPRRPVDRHKPKCKLFNCWLDKPYQKCRACVEACAESGFTKK